MSNPENKRHVLPLELFATLMVVFFLVMMFIYFLFL